MYYVEREIRLVWDLKPGLTFIRTKLYPETKKSTLKIQIQLYRGAFEQLVCLAVGRLPVSFEKILNARRSRSPPPPPPPSPGIR